MNLRFTFTSSRQTFFNGIVLLTLIGLALRLFRLANQSFWMDEITSIMVAQGPLHGIYERSGLASNSLPTYFLLLKLFLENSTRDLEFRARLLSVLAGALSVPVFIGVVYLWCRQRGAALLAGTLLVINPLHLWYSQEVRSYSLMLLFGLLSLLFFELAREKRHPGWWVLYILSAIAAIATHKTGLIFAGACGLWHLVDVFKRRTGPGSLLPHLPILVAALIVLSLKSYPLPEGYRRSANGLEIGYTFLTFVGGFSFGPAVTDIQSYGPWTAISKHALQSGILCLILLALGCITILNFRKFIAGKPVQLLCLGIGVVSVYALLVSGFNYNVRYALPALFGFLALVAVLVTELKNSVWTRILFGALLIVALLADAQWFYVSQYRKDDCRAVAAWLVQNKQRVHSWTVLPQYMNVPIEWYLRPDSDVLARKVPSTEERTTTFPPAPDVLILSRRHHLLQPDQTVASYASAVGGVQTNRAFTGFELYVADRPNNTGAEK